MSKPINLLRKCLDCGLEAKTTEGLELFVKDKLMVHGYQNRCKKCFNRLQRTRWKPACDKSHKKWNPINDPRKIKFLGKHILLKENPRTNVCTKCGRKYPEDLKQQTSMHHEKYDLEDPLAHTTELCVFCHNKERGKTVMMAKILS